MSRIFSDSKPEDALDCQGEERLGGIMCHYGLRGNLNESHPTQQDRIAAYELDVKVDEFKPITDCAFAAMRRSYEIFRETDPSFVGNASVTLAMLDPVEGRLALASKGDAQAYAVLRDKTGAHPPIIKRISSPIMARIKAVGEMCCSDANFLHSDMPAMWAQQDSWKEKSFPYVGGDYPAFALIDLKRMKQDMLKEANIKNVENMSLSLLMASDGLIDGKEPEEDRLRRVAAAVAGDSNKAAAIFNAITDKSLPPRYGSKDNLSAIVFSDLEFGKGKPVAACLCDGSYGGVDDKVAQGGLMAHTAIDCFDQLMQALTNARDEPQTSKGSWLVFLRQNGGGNELPGFK